jgi:hypothetical protein
LKICFGHFGGDENLTGKEIDPGSWSGRIVDMMARYKGRVFADISYHTEAMEGGEKEKHYFANLRRLLNDPERKHAVLWGSDFFLVRQRLRESSYREFYEGHFSRDHFRQISERNAKAYLGMDEEGGAMSRHLDFIAQHAEQIEGEPPAWLLKRVGTLHPERVNTLTAYGNRWTANNQAHVFTFRYLKSAQFSREQSETLRFASSGGMPLRKLAYWHAAGPQQRREDLIFSLAEKIDTVLQQSGVGYEAGYNGNKAIRTLTGVLSSGDRVMADLAETVDALYRFQSESDL